MKEVLFPYGKEKISYQFKDEELAGLLESSINDYSPELNASELIEEAIRNPVGCGRLSELAKEKKNIVIIASDHTRPVPANLSFLRYLRK